MNIVKSVKESKFNLPVYLFPFVAFGLYIIGDMIGGSVALYLVNHLGLSEIGTNRILLASVVASALVIFFWIKVVECRPISSIGLNKQSLGKECIKGAILGLMTFTIILFAGWFMDVVNFQGADYSIVNIVSVLSMLPFWIIQAGAEEILTRGWVLPTVIAKSNRYVGIGISSFLFVCLHLNNAGMNPLALINIFLIGILLAIYTLRSNSLWKAILFHACWNFAQGSLYGLSVSGSASKPYIMSFISQGNELLSGGAFGIEASIITTIVVLILLVGTILIKEKQTSRP